MIRVVIVGKQQLLNELIAELLTRELQAECSVHEGLSLDARFLEYGGNGDGTKSSGGSGRAGDPGNTVPRSLVLLDTAGMELHKIVDELDHRYLKYVDRNLFALFNVSPGTGLEQSAVEHGASGFFYIQDSAEVLVKGVRMLLSGQLWVSRKVLSECVLNRNGRGAGTQDHKPAGVAKNGLTRREMELLSFVALGKTNEQISDALFISTHTVKTHLYHIFKKINVSDRLQAAFWAAQNL